MNENTNLADDPKLTAYALGELEGEEQAEVEALLRGDPAAQAAVEEIRAMAARLEAALGAEPVEELRGGAAPSPGIDQKAAIIAEDDLRKLDGGPLPRDPYGRRVQSKLLRFPQFYFLIGSLAAACFAVLVIVREQERPTFELKQKSLPERQADRLEEARRPEEAAVRTDAQRRAKLAQEAVTAKRAEFGTLAKADKVEMSATTGDEPVALSPYEVKATADGGYFPSAALAGTRVRTNLRDAAGNIAVAMPQVSWDAGSGKGQQALDFYAAPGVAGGAAGNGFNTEAYTYRAESDFLSALQNPLSTFSADVDTASYANVRRFLDNGQRPPADAVRIEELLNYFSYHYAPPAATRDEGTAPPFAASMEVADAPWAAGHRLVRIGLKGREVAAGERGPANLVFLLDVSGSMNEPNKLPLVKESMRLLLGRLRPDDRVAIVVYAGASGLALPSTPAARASEITTAIDELQPGGSTNGAMGIQLAYDIAKANFAPGGINRVVLCTDGDFNVGTTSEGELVRLIQEKAKSGVFLTVLGFGMGNYKDATLQQLADAGNGNYGYIDTRREAEKLLVEQVNGTLVTIAKDVKLQVEFNPAQVASYRLIGYEKRRLNQEDFNNDKVDAGEIGAGHTVTALYEIVPVGAEVPKPDEAPKVDALKYARAAAESVKIKAPDFDELLTLKVRYKDPAGDVSKKLEFPLTDRGERFANASPDFKFAAAVAEFGMILRNSPNRGVATLADVRQWAEAGATDDPGGYRSEFLVLTKRAEGLR